MTARLSHFSKWIQYLSRGRRPKNSQDRDATQSVSETGIGAESPIHKASEDRLRRTDFARRLAGVLSEVSAADGRTFAIRGSWGYGKSSLKNLVIEKLQAGPNGARWLDFNPWQWGSGDAITRALFWEIADQVGGKFSSKARKRAKMFRRYGDLLSRSPAALKQASKASETIQKVLSYGIVVAAASSVDLNLPTVVQVGGALALLAIVFPAVGGLLSHLGRDMSAQSLDEIRSELVERMKELDRPLVVFIDDIDRLEPDQIRTVLRQVKANGNLPNIVFVLLYQSSIVEHALNPVANGDGRSFLEKIVQANFDLPLLPASAVHHMFAMDLQALVQPYLCETNGFSQRRWNNAFVGSIQPRLRNLRDARRLMSSIAIHLPLHATEDALEVNIVDFLVLETLRVFESELHSALFQHRDLLLQGRRGAGRSQDDATQAALGRLLASVPEGRIDYARDVVQELFPSVEWALGGSEYEGDHGWTREKRVCTARYFQRYFELQTPEGEISAYRFDVFLAGTDDAATLSEVVAELQNEGLLGPLAARLDEASQQLPVANAAILLPAMFRIGQHLADHESQHLMDTAWTSAWRATNRYLRRIEPHARQALVLAALQESQALSMGSMLIGLSDTEERENGRSSPSDPALDAATVAAMKHLWLEILQTRAANGLAFATEPDLISHLYRWRDYTHAFDEPRAWVARAISTDWGFVQVVSRMTTSGTSYSGRDVVATAYTHLNAQAIEDFIGSGIALARCQSIDPSQVPEHVTTLQELRDLLERQVSAARQ